LSSTVLSGKFWLRACIVNPRARREDIDELIQLRRATTHFQFLVFAYFDGV